jgi:hypothetical protein
MQLPLPSAFSLALGIPKQVVFSMWPRSFDPPQVYVEYEKTPTLFIDGLK